MPAIPASATVTNLLSEPLAVAGLKTFAVAEVRVINLAAFHPAQKTVVWNALYNAVQQGWASSPDVTFSVTPMATGHQGVTNSGGQGTGIDYVNVPGGLSLPASVMFTNLLSEPLEIAGIRLDAHSGSMPSSSPEMIYGQPVDIYGVGMLIYEVLADTVTVDLSALPINQQAQLWNGLINARDKGLISSTDLTTAVELSYTGHQGSDNGGGHGPGRQIQVLVQTP